MDCFTARRTLTAIRADSDDWHDSAFAQAAMHLRRCLDCQAACEAEQEFDREFARACLDIRMPAGLHDRLLVALALDTEPEAPLEKASNSKRTGDNHEAPEPSLAPSVSLVDSNAPTRSARGISRRGLMFGLASAACVLIAAALGLALRTSFPKSSIEHVLESATTVELDSGAELAEGANLLPTLLADSANPLPTLMNCPEGLREARIHSFTIDPQQPMGSVRFFRFGPRSRPFQALLVLLDRRRLNAGEWAALGSSFSKAPTIYKNGDAARVWKEGNCVYVCVIKKQGAEGFDLLAPRPNQA